MGVHLKPGATRLRERSRLRSLARPLLADRAGRDRRVDR